VGAIEATTVAVGPTVGADEAASDSVGWDVGACVPAGALELQPASSVSAAIATTPRTTINLLTVPVS
jgi:hypothetical protein